MNEPTSVDLNLLREAGRVTLPRMAGDYQDIAGCLAGAKDTSGFNHPGEFGANEMTRAWGALHGHMWTAADDAAKTLFGIGQVLGKAVDDFAAHDAGLARQLKLDRESDEQQPTLREYTGPGYQPTHAPGWDEGAVRYQGDGTYRTRDGRVMQ